MRLHGLSATAFGPFAETVAVDFDDLSAGGLFLLTGDTGAGKTSVLDAVCFALYGEVPGERHTARHLRSDHADPQAEPRVTLELTVGERTFRFTRSPAWERPKRRGQGTTRVQAHVVVEELRDDGWIPLTTRLDEAGQLVVRLLGMTCAQFTQVAMLPQNRFQAFLRASSAERQAVLQRLFRTERFEDVERWLAERRLVLRRESQAGHDQVAAVLHRFEEAGATGVPEEWDVHDLAARADDGSLATWAGQVHEAALGSASAAEARVVPADEALAEARERVTRARAATDRRERGTRAREVLLQLDETAGEEQGRARRLAGHRRAAPVVPLVRRAGAATTALDDAEEAAAVHVADMAELLELDAESIDSSALDAAATAAAEQRAVAESWLPREAELAAGRTQADELAAEVERLSSTVASTRAELAAIAPRRTSLARRADEHARVFARAAEQRTRLDLAEQALAAADEALELTRVTGEQRRALEASVRLTQDLRDEHLDLREARIHGMAAELASGLAVGGSCPVCGSAEHPAPATAERWVTRDDEEAARARYETAAFEQQALRESVAALESRLQVALVRSEGHRTPYWRRRVAEARTGLEVATAAGEREAEDRAALAELERAEARATALLAASQVSLAERSAALKHAMLRRGRLETELRDLLEGHDQVSVAELVEHQAARVATLAAARTALARVERLRADRETAVAEAVSAASEAGFAGPRQAMAAHLSDHDAGLIEADLDRRRSTRATATAVLDDPEVRAALQAPAPDLEQLQAAVAEAADDRDLAHAAARQATARAARLGTLLEELTDALRRWEPQRRQHAVAAELSALVEGRSAANAWRMRLAAYVLSERLRQVVAAANERLASMTDERYALEQVDERGAGEQRGGLSLRVRDQWSGTQRDPATLSGGETFLVSLALALGLADTVSHEAGGTQLDTLFIDEGFGALDARTLDSVMDVLDSLRDGGRVVGVVSHVPELRNRITTQLEVAKGRRGSTVRTVA
jgi:exonuclease SbcC